MKFTKPKPPIPESLRGLPPGTWAHDTIVRRFGEIVGRVLADTSRVFEADVVGRLEGLVGEIPYGAVRLLEDEAPDAEAWAGYVEPYVGLNWLEVPWFFVETYFYRRILEAVGYFARGRNSEGARGRRGEGARGRVGEGARGRGYASFGDDNDNGRMSFPDVAYQGRRLAEAGGGATEVATTATTMIDPFAYEKRRGLEVTRGTIRRLSSDLGELLGDEVGRREAFVRLLKVDLWGNKADLSLWPASASEGEGEGASPPDLFRGVLTEGRRELGGTEGLGKGASPPDLSRGTREQGGRGGEVRILVDDSQAVADYVFGLDAEGARVDFMVDNAGFELACDLCLADFMLSTNLVGRVIFHLKHHPTFVSDAMIKDVRETLAFFAGDEHPELRALGERLEAHLHDGRFEWRDDPYWTSSLAFWELPDALRQELAHSDLLISKGDANYRRLLGDRDWPFTTPFADIMRYTPAPLLALRTLKAELAAGLQAEQIESVSQQDANWLVNGQWGVVQFVKVNN